MREETWYKMIVFRQALQEVRSAIREDGESMGLSDFDGQLDNLTVGLLADDLILRPLCPCAADCIDALRINILKRSLTEEEEKLPVVKRIDELFTELAKTMKEA